MMPEQKGRSGKKPKYQIPDIGGADLTAQDISTERVLNFLIKGETVSPESGADPNPEVVNIRASDAIVPATSSQTAEDKAAGASLPASESSSKKSLAHLFERASSGSSIAKDLPLHLPAGELAGTSSESPARSEAVQINKDPGQQESNSYSLPDHVSGPLSGRSKDSSRSTITSAGIISEPPVGEDNSPTPVLITETVPELAHYIELWKNFYRLKSGEVDALTVMYHLSYGQGRTECHVKMRNLAEMSNLTYRYCQKVVRSLEQLGWITKLKEYDPMDQLGVLYRVNLKPLDIL